jgi:lipoprotein-anchoring transpeptidase ErfK/SrfK
MVLRSAIALATLSISVAALVEHAGAQYVPVYGQPSPPRPYAAIPRPKQSDEGQISGPADAHPNYGSLPPEDQAETDAKGVPPEFQRQLVNYQTTEPAGTIIIDTPATYLYLLLGHGRALRYGVGVGREGFTWAGTQRIARMAGLASAHRND